MTNKNEFAEFSTRQLRARRQRLAAQLGDPQEVLAGSLAVQARRCGKPGCRCAGPDGELHGPYVYFTPRPGRAQLRYVPAGLVEVVRRYLQRGREVEVVLAQISAINAELLARRELE